MDFHREQDTQHYGIHAYAKGEITVTIPSALEPGPKPDNSGNVEQLHLPIRREILRRSLVIMPSALIRDWEPQSFESLAVDHFQALAELDIELILFGSGGALRWPSRELLSPLMEKGIGIEVMDTGAACRTYNILQADQRRFAAALLMID